MFPWFRKRENVRDGGTRAGRTRNRPALESLERRELLAGTQPYALAGDRWSNATPITFSIAADGLTWDRNTNVLNAAMDARFAAGTWQDEIARALQTWASVADVDFVRVADSALDFDTVGREQGDPRLGDIRFGGYDFGNASQLAHAFAPPPNGSTAAGDVAINTAMAFNIGGDFDLFSVVLHETGHSLGLEHPDNTDVVMNQNYGGVRAGLEAGDIAGIRSIYGDREDDVYGQQGQGSGFSDAATVTMSSASPSRISLADLTLTTIGDSDYFRFVPATRGALQVSASVEGISLLSPRVSLFDASQTLLDAGGSPAQYGRDVSARVAEVEAGQPYYIRVSGATSDVFSIGTYDLDISFEGRPAAGATGRVPQPTRITEPLPDTPPDIPPLSPSPPTTRNDPAGPFRQPPWRKQTPRFPVARQRKPQANAGDQARTFGPGRRWNGDRTADGGRSPAAPRIVARASSPNRPGSRLASPIQA